MSAAEMQLAARALGAAKTELWRHVRASEIKAAIDQGRAVERACEDFRRRFFPRAREVVVTCDREIGQELSVFTRSATGRTRLVYEEPTP